MQFKIRKLLSAIQLFCKRNILSIIEFLKGFLSFLSSHANLLAALATFFLALLTFSHITVTKRMAEETKRLADINTEQFKIKSYPTFLVELERIKPEPERLLKKLKIRNKGEITAYNVTFLLVQIYQRNDGLSFCADLGTYYESEERMTSINFETKIWKGSSKTIVSSNRFLDGCNIDNLKYLLLFIKFKVPYDTKYRYEVLGYILTKEYEKEKEPTYIWQEISINDRTNLIQRYLNLSSTWEQPIKLFFVDYDIELSETSNEDNR